MIRSLLLASLPLALAAQTPAPKPAEAPKPAAKPAAAPEVDKVLARIAGETVKESDFQAFLDASVPEQQRAQMAFVPGARDTYLKRFLEFKLMAAKARKDGLDKTAGYQRKRAMMELQGLIQTLFERDGAALQAKAKLSDDEVKAYFEAHPDQFRNPETFTSRHILVSTKGSGADKGLSDDEAKAKIAKIQEELKAGKSFDAAAKEHSDDPGSKDKGGLYENIAFGRFVPEFEAAVRAQKAGEVGAPVKTMHGYHLILVEKINPAVPQTFDAAKEAARQKATAERQESLMKAYLDGIKKEVSFIEGDAAKAPAKPAKKGAK